MTEATQAEVSEERGAAPTWIDSPFTLFFPHYPRTQNDAVVSSHFSLTMEGPRGGGHTPASQAILTCRDWGVEREKGLDLG